MKDEKPKFEHQPDAGDELRQGYCLQTIPTQYPSVGLSDLMGHTRRVATREDKDEVQDIGPRLKQDDIRRHFPSTEITAYDLDCGEEIEDKQYDEQYEDPRRPHQAVKEKVEP